jgi:hypothetical protein
VDTLETSKPDDLRDIADLRWKRHGAIIWRPDLGSDPTGPLLDRLAIALGARIEDFFAMPLPDEPTVLQRG